MANKPITLQFLIPGDASDEDVVAILAANGIVDDDPDEDEEDESDESLEEDSA